MQTSTNDQRLLLKKNIYAKRKPATAEVVADILRLDITTHLSNHPDLEFDKLTGPTENSDRSMTYNLHFKRKL